MAIRVLIISLAFAVFSAISPGAMGPIPVEPGEPVLVKKIRVIDSRAVRGFIGAPVDGTLKSGSWDGKVWEYPMSKDAGAGVGYEYLKNNGLHLTLADADGFNAVVIGGGAKARLLRDVAKFDDPASGKPVCEFSGNAKEESAWFDEPIKTSRLSLFDARDGIIGDVSFFRVARGLGGLKSTPEPFAGFPEEIGLAAIGVQLDVERDQKFSISIADPLNPRITLHSANYIATAAGRAHVICDFPDQIVPAGAKMSISVSSSKNVTITRYAIPKEQARDEALAYRKFLLHAFYTPVSEPRPWNVWNQPGDDEKYLKSGDTGDLLQDRLRPLIRELVMTLNQCRELDPEGKDPVVRQMHEWMYRKILTKSGKMPKFATNFDRIDGVPEWAALVHQAWMQAREVPKWWMENRLVPSGEFGGVISDDTDMYQNYAPFPMLERDGVGGMLLEAGERLWETAQKQMLDDGMNKRSMDPLHAYEEGLNQEALLAYWNYGDPHFFEACMAAARMTEPLTMVTAKGHRHFRGNSVGIDEARSPDSMKLDREHGSHCLMWHPTLIVAWYHRNPLAMKWLGEWGDGWLDHMKAGEEGTDVKLPEDETSKSDPLPFMGGWGMTGSVFTWLADISGDARFVRPYTEYFAREKKNTGFHFAEIAQMGMTDAAIADPPWNHVLYKTGDKKPLLDAMKKDIEELQRFKYMYTEVECFTDRVFLYAAINPAIAYTGGYTTRNKLNLTYAVSWDGFRTDYAALVTVATRDRLKVLLCNVSDKPISGTARVWRLEPGEYELTIGPDSDGDDAADRIERTEKLTITKGDEIKITLPPKVVQVLELKQIRRGEPVFNRPDLAIATREIRVDGAKVSGVVHNIGGAKAEGVVATLMDGEKVVQTRQLGELAAPVDLVAKTIPFEFDAQGTSVVVSCSSPEIFAGNNRAAIRE